MITSDKVIDLQSHSAPYLSQKLVKIYVQYVAENNTRRALEITFCFAEQDNHNPMAEVRCGQNLTTFIKSFNL